MKNNSKYSSIATTLISVPIINDIWGNLNNAAGVTVGTDNWDMSLDIAPAEEFLFFSRVGATGDNNSFFNNEDRPYIHDVRICCNFADGLVPVSNTLQSNFANPIVASPAIDSAMAFRLETQSVNANDGVSGNGSLDFYIPTFQDKFTLAQFAPINTYTITNKGFFLSTSLNSIDVAVNGILFSTISINTSFQDSRVLVWAEIDVEHTFPLTLWS